MSEKEPVERQDKIPNEERKAPGCSDTARLKNEKLTASSHRAAQRLICNPASNLPAYRVRLGRIRHGTLLGPREPNGDIPKWAQELDGRYDRELSDKYCSGKDRAKSDFLGDAAFLQMLDDAFRSCENSLNPNYVKILDWGIGSWPYVYPLKVFFQGYRDHPGASKRQLDIIGIDMQPWFIRHACRVITEEGWRNIQALQADGTRLTRYHDDFDVVMLCRPPIDLFYSPCIPKKCNPELAGILQAIDGFLTDKGILATTCGWDMALKDLEEAVQHYFEILVVRRNNHSLGLPFSSGYHQGVVLARKRQ